MNVKPKIKCPKCKSQNIWKKFEGVIFVKANGKNRFSHYDVIGGYLEFECSKCSETFNERGI